MLGFNEIYNMDCLEGMKRMADESINLIVTDPPYLMNYRSNRRVKQEKFDYIKNDTLDTRELIQTYLKECYRMLLIILKYLQ
jgi:site-specific DNA-methyltransferase (adenine-specific)